MNIMWTPNRKLGLCGKTNSGVVGDTHPSKSEVVSGHFSNSALLSRWKAEQISVREHCLVGRINPFISWYTVNDVKT